MKVSVQHLKENTREILDQAQHQRARVVIERRNKPTAAIVPMEDYRLLEELFESFLDANEDVLDALVAQAGWDAYLKGAPTVSLSEAEKRLGTR